MPPSRPPYDTDLAAEQAVVAAFRDAGAVAPERAARLRDVGLEPSEAVGVLVVRGTIREGAPGRYYLYDGPTMADVAPAAGARPPRGLSRRLLLFLLFWVVVLLLPVIFLQLAR